MSSDASRPEDRSPHSPEDPSPQPASPPHLDMLPSAGDPDILRVLAIGTRPVVNCFVHRLHQLNVAHYSEWSRLLPTRNPGEFMRILTKRIAIAEDAPEQPRSE